MQNQDISIQTLNPDEFGIRHPWIIDAKGNPLTENGDNRGDYIVPFFDEAMTATKVWVCLTRILFLELKRREGVDIQAEWGSEVYQLHETLQFFPDNIREDVMEYGDDGVFSRVTRCDACLFCCALQELVRTGVFDHHTRKLYVTRAPTHDNLKYRSSFDLLTIFEYPLKNAELMAAVLSPIDLLCLQNLISDASGRLKWIAQKKGDLCRDWSQDLFASFNSGAENTDDYNGPDPAEDSPERQFDSETMITKNEILSVFCPDKSRKWLDSVINEAGIMPCFLPKRSNVGQGFWRHEVINAINIQKEKRR